MKKTIFTILFSFIFLSAFAVDKITLMNQTTFIGEVKKIKDCQVEFKVDGDKYLIPADDIYSIEFEDKNNSIYKDYLSLSESDPEACLKGTADAGQFHGKQGGHVVLGVLFGPFAMIGTLLSNPSPYRGKNTVMLSENKDLFTDPVYLKCYEKKAKGNLILMEGIGWGAWIVFVLVLTSQS